MKITIEKIANDHSEHRDDVILEKSEDWKGYVLIDNEYHINIGELITALMAISGYKPNEK